MIEEANLAFWFLYLKVFKTVGTSKLKIYLYEKTIFCTKWINGFLLLLWIY